MTKEKMEKIISYFISSIKYNNTNKYLFIALLLLIGTIESKEENLNGINLQNLSAFMEQLRKDPLAGQITFFTKTKWESGMRSATNIGEYELDGKSKNKRNFTITGDKISELGAADSAPSSIEQMMCAFGTSIVASVSLNATLKKVQLSKIEVYLESDLDFHGTLGLDPNIRPGILDFRIVIHIGGNADEAALREIAIKGYELSPVSDTVKYGITSINIPNIFATSTKIKNKSADTKVMNGLKVDVLNSFIDSLKKDSSLGKAVFFSNTQWEGGTKSITTFGKYQMNGKEINRSEEKKFVLYGDQIKELGGFDLAACGVEELMTAMGISIISAGTANAVFMGVHLTKFEVLLESDLDLHGLTGLDPLIRPGILYLRVKINISGDADREILKKIAMKGYELSAVSDTMKNSITTVETPQIVVIK